MEKRITYLFMQYYNNRSTRKELEEFFQLIKAATHDEELNKLIKNVYDEIKHSNPSLTYINEEGKLVLQEPDWLYESVSNSSVTPVQRRKRTIFAVAATALLIIGTGIALWKISARSDTAEITVVKKFTERTEHRYLLLSDSTQVWLNGSSSIDYPEKFDSKKREIYLSGEAYFDVKHADKVPFVIHTGDITTVVLGTAFNIKAYKGQKHITVAVKRGKVCVMQKDRVISTLIKGQEIKIGDKSRQFKTIEKAGEDNKIGAWQYGYLVYEEESLTDILSDFQRVYNVEIQIENEQLKDLAVTTSLNRDIGIHRALEILCKLTDAQLEMRNNQYIIK